MLLAHQQDPLSHLRVATAGEPLRAGFAVVSQRDFRMLSLLHAWLDSSVEANPSFLDHHQTAWYLQEFNI